jgi:hypothetical protein
MALGFKVYMLLTLKHSHSLAPAICIKQVQLFRRWIKHLPFLHLVDEVHNLDHIYPHSRNYLEPTTYQVLRALLKGLGFWV